MTETKQRLASQFNELIGPVSLKRLFTGYGIFKENIMFVLCESGNKTYLHAEGELVKTLEKLGAARYSDITPQMNPNLTLYHYYRLPLEVMENKALFKKLLYCSLAQIKAKKLKEAILKRNRIKELTNLSIKYERLLAKVEIKTVEEFRQIGADNAFVRLRKLGISANEQLYLLLYAALRDRNVHTLTKKEKEKALLKLNLVLEANGLRPLKLKKIEEDLDDKEGE